MKRLALLLLFALVAFVPRPAQAQASLINSYFCIANDYNLGERFSCYTSMSGYLVYASMETIGSCSQGQAPDAAENVYAACSDWYPTATATGFATTGDYNRQIPGKVTALATLNNAPGNPSASKSVDCYGVPTVSIQPILPC